MQPAEYKLITNGDMSQATITSPSVEVIWGWMSCFQAVFTGAPVGTFKLQVSNDNVNWTDYTGSSRAITVAGDLAYNLTDEGYPYQRLVYTKTSGTGTLNVTVNKKGI